MRSEADFTIPEETPDCVGFQLQLAPNGVCRIVVLGEDGHPRRAVAILNLDAADADRLAHELLDRRGAYLRAQPGEQPQRPQ
ncbi:hypothetical protein [Methylobacterium gnaphalii]|uniref:Uncharacterized protein n=1 Tax=Methylobacterium gnaphalii TaxID=1010610 RepID=A0A512JQN1_9HYPH|nr:hypothetical protein [Methylobacterium gnaphalii]GEP12277.1 hypothetical protein MGN01_41220 [Methylobacterium gnaphalii]GJD68720.1 hypothetical protein MMMDOFMJ_1644 [Methylobacterium gnaphalii]GLS49384.1 hypothetical protein GCM10007885_22320 [Methylobacterium gnaphalii]